MPGCEPVLLAASGAPHQVPDARRCTIDCVSLRDFCTAHVTLPSGTGLDAPHYGGTRLFGRAASTRRVASFADVQDVQMRQRWHRANVGHPLRPVKQCRGRWEMPSIESCSLRSCTHSRQLELEKHRHTLQSDLSRPSHELEEVYRLACTTNSEATDHRYCESVATGDVPIVDCGRLRRHRLSNASRTVLDSSSSPYGFLRRMTPSSSRPS